MIRWLKADNFKALNNFRLELSPFTVLIGDNSAGKSSVLQAIAFLKYCCVFSPEAFLNERGIPAAELCSKHGTRKIVSFSVGLELQGEKLTWELSMTRMKDHFELRQEKVSGKKGVLLSYGGSGMSYRLNYLTGEKDSVMEGSFGNSIIRFTDETKQAEQYPALIAIKRFFEHLETLDLLSPVNMKRSSKGESRSIGTGGEKLGSFIKTLSSADREKLAGDVRGFLKQFATVTPKTRQYGWVHLETKENYSGRNVEISAASASDGAMRIIALCSLRYLQSEGAILLDEIEDGINNEHLELLVTLLRSIEKEKNTQIIATTHNTALLDYWINKAEIGLNEAPESDEKETIVFLFRNNMGEVSARNVLTSAEVRERLSYMYPGEVVQSMTNEELVESLNGVEER